ncbi:hypothetical protein AB0392_15760 [Nonomuraea angiospora]|uniref:hypothetical protein n=1 Tax=Nonomuraea angiospora TaxID=46172 RepID=UPI00344F9BEB
MSENTAPQRLPLASAAAAVVVMAGLVSLFATYWDDAWHTDIGRDDALIPPHLLLYGSVAVVGLVVAGWGLLALWRTRSLIAVLRRPPLLIAGIGGLVTLASAPADAWWHEVFGRDSVLWSPSHMLTVFSTLALIGGVLAGLRPAAPLPLWWAGGALLLGSAVMSVLEFETDVPQFSEALYLPVLLVASMYVAILLRALSPDRHLVAGAVVVYVLARLVISVLLAAMGRTVPDLPLAVIGLAAIDLPWRRPFIAYAAGAAGVAATTLLSAGVGLSSVSFDAVLGPAAVVLIGFCGVLLLMGRRARGAAAVALLLGLSVPVLVPKPASAHDPGQGQIVGTAVLTAGSDGAGTVTLTVEGCVNLTPQRIVARRAGQEIAGPLTQLTGGCRSSGQVRVDPAGMWFLYAELRDPNGTVETWLPVETEDRASVRQTRPIYIPAGTARVTAGQIAAGAGLYVIGLFMLSLTVYLVRRGHRRPDVGRRGIANRPTPPTSTWAAGATRRSP